jgi:hypothetical protein
MNAMKTTIMIWVSKKLKQLSITIEYKPKSNTNNEFGKRNELVSNEKY